MFSLATVTLSPSSLEISSSAGAIMRHGPHHSAQKSTRTAPSAPSTSVSKLWSVTVLVAISANLLTEPSGDMGTVAAHLNSPARTAKARSYRAVQSAPHVQEI